MRPLIDSLGNLFKVRPEETRKALMLVGLMVFTSAGGSIGGNGIDAMFLSRYGVRFLPQMYIALGFVALATTIVVAILLARFPPERLFVLMPLVIAGTLLVERVVIASGARWIYPVTWVGMNVKGALQALLTWGLAGLVFDTRQSKRLFPLFGAGNILGAVIGGLSTPSIARVIHAENLLLVWVAALLLAFATGAGISASTPKQSRQRIRRNAIQGLRQGYRTVWRSPFLVWLALAAVAYAILMYSIAFPFSKAVAARFVDEDALAGFLGVFQGLSTGIAFAISLFIANRLFSRFGIIKMIAVFPLIYLLGFGVLLVAAPFVLIAAFRFVQAVWQQGIFFSAYQASFNVVPPDRKDQARTFIEGAGSQAGTVVAGVLLLFGDRVLKPRALFLVGLIIAVVGLAITLKASRGYGLALLDALREGRPHVFFAEEEPFGGFQHDAAAIDAAVQGLKGADRSIRRISAEILSRVSDGPSLSGVVGRGLIDSLVAALNDRDDSVRVFAVRGLVKAGAAHALREIAELRRDPQAQVRKEAVIAFQKLSPSPAEAAEFARPMLRDADPEVRAQAAVTLLRSRSGADTPPAIATIEHMMRVEGAFTSVAAVAALGEWGDESVVQLVLEQAVCPEPPVRRAAAIALAHFDPTHAVPALIALLRDADPRVRHAAVESLAELGDSALNDVVRALGDPALEDAALSVLERNAPINSSRAAELEEHAREASASAVRYIDLWKGARSSSGDERVELLADALRDRALTKATVSLRSLGAITDSQRIRVVLENLSARDSSQRANALETLESGGHREIVAPLIGLWETGSDTRHPRDWLTRVLHEDDTWLRMCGLMASTAFPAEPELTSVIGEIAKGDPSEEVRQTAAKILSGPMETLATTSLLERILLLRRVPLFADLASEDLKQLASIAGERTFSEGEPIAREGEAGDEMYVIVSGEVGVVIGMGSSSEAEVARRIPGDYVGEMSLITRGTRTATLMAHDVVRVLFIDQRHFESLIRERPDVSLNLMRALVEKVHESNRLLPQDLAVKLETARVRRSMAGETRTVTVLFCDLTGPGPIVHNLDREEWSQVMDRVYEALVGPVYRYEGTLGRMIGDAILAFFGAPIAHDDDPARAVRAAMQMVGEIQEVRKQLAAELGVDFNVRVGINTGPVEVGEMGSDLVLDYTSLGDEVNIAARMEQTASPGSIQISENTQELVAEEFDLEDLGPIDVKGLSKPVNTFRVRGARTNSISE